MSVVAVRSLVLLFGQDHASLRSRHTVCCIVAPASAWSVEETERKNFFVEFALDAVDVTVKAAVFINFSVNGNKTCEEALKDGQVDSDGECIATDSYFIWIALLLAAALSLTTIFSGIRVGNMKDMLHVATHGYSTRWKVKERVRGGEGGKDPRIQRDAEARMQQHFKMRTFQAFAADLPWIFFNVYRIAQGSVAVIDLASVCVAGFGFGMKFQAFLALVKHFLFVGGAKDKKDVYQILPADVKCGSAASNLDDTEGAVYEAYMQASAQVTGTPTFIWICMTAPHDHEKGLAKLREIAPNIPSREGSRARARDCLCGRGKRRRFGSRRPDPCPSGFCVRCDGESVSVFTEAKESLGRRRAGRPPLSWRSWGRPDMRGSGTRAARRARASSSATVRSARTTRLWASG